MPFDGVNYQSGTLIPPVHAHPNAIHTGAAYSQTLINAYAKCREPRILGTLFPAFLSLGYGSSRNFLSLDGDIDINVASESLPAVTSTGSTNGTLWRGRVAYLPEHCTHVGATVYYLTVASAGGEHRFSLELTDGTNTDADQQAYPFEASEPAGSVGLFTLAPTEFATEIDTVVTNAAVSWAVKCNPVSDDGSSATVRLVGATVYGVSL